MKYFLKMRNIWLKNILNIFVSKMFYKITATKGLVRRRGLFVSCTDFKLIPRLIRSGQCNNQANTLQQVRLTIVHLRVVHFVAMCNSLAVYF